MNKAKRKNTQREHRIQKSISITHKVDFFVIAIDLIAGSPRGAPAHYIIMNVRKRKTEETKQDGCASEWR